MGITFITKIFWNPVPVSLQYMENWASFHPRFSTWIGKVKGLLRSLYINIGDADPRVFKELCEKPIADVIVKWNEKMNNGSTFILHFMDTKYKENIWIWIKKYLDFENVNQLR